MVVGRSQPYFAQWIARRAVPARRVGPIVARGILALQYAEKIIHPRWLSLARRLTPVVGLTVLFAGIHDAELWQKKVRALLSASSYNAELTA
jgi:hypothetical protein